jgi:hypothetical protein
MKAFPRLLFLLLCLVLHSCIPDPVAPDNDPDLPTIDIGPKMQSRLFIQLTGSFIPRPDIVEYGFEVAENAFGVSPDTLILNPPKDSETSFSCTLQLRPGITYVFRSFMASTLQKKYSKVITRQMPATSAALLSDVSWQNGRLTAMLLDDGGRHVSEMGFCYGKSAELKEMKQNRIPCTLEGDHTLSARIPELEFGQIYYFRAYAENSDEAANEVYAYSPSTLSLTYSEDFPAPIADPIFEQYLTRQQDRNGDGVFSYRDLVQVTEIQVRTDSITSLAEIRRMPLLTSLSCCGSTPGKGLLDTLDVSGNPLLETLNCKNNRLTGLDVSDNPALNDLDCTGNPLLTQLWLNAGQTLASLQYDADITTVCYRGDIPPEVDSGIVIADPNFKAFLLNAFDQDKDGFLSEEEAESIVTLNISTDNIASISEIVHFSRLSQLICTGSASLGGKLTELDLSGNPELTYLNCDFNQLKSLNLAPNPKLTYLSCQGNQLSSLDVTGNLALRYLSCINNPSLTEIGLLSGQTISLQYDIGTAELVYKDLVIPDDDPDFPVADPLFRAYLFTHFDTDNDGHLSKSEREAITRISVCTDNITSISEIRFFPNLRELSCCGTEYNRAGGCTGQLDSLNVSQNPLLLSLECDFNKLVQLDVSRNPLLQALSCSANPIEKLIFGETTRLTSLLAPHTNLTRLDLTPLPYLQSLKLSYGKLAELDVTPLTQLTALDLYFNDLDTIDLSQNSQLTTLDIGANLLTVLDLSHNTHLSGLECRGELFEADRIYKNEYGRIVVQRGHGSRVRGFLSKLDLSYNSELRVLHCAQNRLNALDVSQNPLLEYLRFSNNKISAIDLRKNPFIYDIECNNNLLKELDVSDKTELVNLYCGENQISVLNVSKSPLLKNFYCAYNLLTHLDVSNNPALSYLNCCNNPTLFDIWLQTGQSIANFQYDSTVSKVYYK